MKVLVVSHMYPCTAHEVGGLFVHDQARALVEAGVDVRVVSPKAWTPWPVPHLRPKWKAMSKIPSHAEREGISVLSPRYLVLPRGWMFSSSGRRMYHGIRSCVRRLHREFPFDLIHAHVALPDGYAGMLLAQGFEVPLVVTIHGQDAYVTARRSPTRRAAVGRVLEAADAVIAVSTKLKQLLVEQHGNEMGQHLHVIPNGVDPAKLGLRDADYADAPCRSKEARLLSVGYLIPRKAHLYVLRAVSDLLQRGWDIQYDIVGDGPGRQQLASLVEALGLDERVRFHGLLRHQVAMAMMRQCDVFVLPSWEEAFGVVYVEAMAHGKPVIGCQGEGIEDFVEHGKTGLLVKPRDLDSLVEALDYLLSHPEEAKAMGERAREVVLENYTWEKNAEKTVQIYREVLDER